MMIIITVPRYPRPTVTGFGTQNSISLLTCSITGLCSQTFLVSVVQGPGENLQISTSRHSPFSYPASLLNVFFSVLQSFSTFTRQNSLLTDLSSGLQLGGRGGGRPNLAGCGKYLGPAGPGGLAVVRLRTVNVKRTACRVKSFNDGHCETSYQTHHSPVVRSSRSSERVTASSS